MLPAGREADRNFRIFGRQKKKGHAYQLISVPQSFCEMYYPVNL